MPFYRIVTSKDQRPSIVHLHLAGCTAKTIFKQLPLRTVYNDFNRSEFLLDLSEGLPPATFDVKKTRLKRFRERLKRFSQARHSDILFTDECLFSTDQFLNTQNDRMIARSSAEASQHGGIAQRSGQPKPLMDFGAITSDGKMSLISLEKGVKVDSKTYLEGMLEKELLP
uniref:Transposase n=1 Tax=Haemonchus contortus TaxID=6289 RepID=A0A7I4YBY9_HAECO